jgi:tetratricopeptide (TPR) repeat protein
MDVSKLIWALVIVAVVGGGWLLTSGGVNYMYNNATKATVGQDASKDETDEAALSKWGGFLLSTFQYEKAQKFYQTAVDRYPAGKNFWWNCYQLARAEEKLKNYEKSVQILTMLRDQNADAQDERVPDFDNLNLRINKLRELHEIPEA